MEYGCKCPRCGNDLMEQRTVYISSVDGPAWHGTVMLRCDTCDIRYERPISLMVLDEE